MDEQQVKQPEAKPEAHTESSFGVPLKTILLIVLLAIIAALLTYVAISPKGKLNEVLKQTPMVKENNADSTLSVLNAEKNSDGTYSSIVYLDSGKNTVTGVQLELYYDPKVVSNVTISPLDYFSSATEALKTIDQPNGRISYAIGTSLGESGVMSKGNLAKITFTLTPNPDVPTTSFNFMPKTSVHGNGTDESLLKETKDGQITLITTSPTTQPVVSQ